MKIEAIRQYATENGIKIGKIEPIVRRADPLDTAAGAHIPSQGDIEILVDRQNETVYKIGPGNKLPKYRQEFQTLTAAIDGGVKVPTPRAEPRLSAEWAIFASEYIDHDPKDSPSPEATGKLLSGLHSIEVPDFEPAISRLGILANYVLENCHITAEIRKKIVHRCLPCVEVVTQDMSGHNNLLHGDIHLGNVLPTRPSPTLIDFEDSGRGSPLWDLAVLVQSSTRFGLKPEWVNKCLDTWQQASKKEIPEEMLQNYVDWRYWYGALSLIKRVNAGENLTLQLQTRTKWILDPTDQSKWLRC